MLRVRKLEVECFDFQIRNESSVFISIYIASNRNVTSEFGNFKRFFASSAIKMPTKSLASINIFLEFVFDIFFPSF